MHCDAVLGEEIREKIERLKWSLWHGNLYKAFYKIDDLESVIYNFEETYPKFKQLHKAVEEFRTSIDLQKMNWKCRTGVHEHTGVSLQRDFGPP